MKKTGMIVLSILSLNLFSQNKVEKMGPEFDTENIEFFDQTIGQDKSGFYTLRSNSKGSGYNYSIEKFSKLDLIKTKQIAAFGLSASSRILGCIYRKEKIYCLSREYNSKDRIFEITINEVDANSENQEPKKTIIKQQGFDYYTKWFLPTVHYFLSPDSSKIGFICSAKEERILEVYNLSDFKKIVTKVIPNSFEGKETSIINCAIDNAGDLFYVFESKDDYDDNTIFISKVAIDKPIVYKINSKQNTMFLNSNFLIDSKNGQLYFCSVFADYKGNSRKTFENVGLYISKFQLNNLKFSGEKYHDFANEILNRLTCNFSMPNLNLEYDPFNYMTNSGDIIFEISHRYRYVGQDVSDYAEEIITAKFNTSLNLIWMKLIPRCLHHKKNYGPSPLGNSKFINEDKIIYTFMEDPKVTKKNIDFLTASRCDIPFLSSFKNANLVSYTLDLKTGNLTKQLVYVNEGSKRFMLDSETINFEKNKYIIRFKDGNKESYGILNLN